jgi:hypothetical protein
MASASPGWRLTNVAFGDTVRSGVVGEIAQAERFNGKRWHTARLPGAGPVDRRQRSQLGRLPARGHD